MKLRSSPLRLIIAGVLSTSGTGLMVPYGGLSQNGAPWQFQMAIALMAVGWLVSLRWVALTARSFWILAVGLRLILLPMQPGADVHRYIWEGRIQNYGFDPYRNDPGAEKLIPLRDENWSHVEFKESSAIYPPLTELGFRALAMISGSVLLFKLAFIAADLLVCLLLSKQFGFERSVVYAWNPLVLYSFAGGAHFDSWFIAPLVAGWILWEKQRSRSAALFFAAATAIKWIALPVLVWSIFRIGASKGKWTAAAATFGALLILALPWLVIIGGDLNAPLLPKQFVLYARSFGLLPTVLSWLWPSKYFENSVFLPPLLVAMLILMASRTVAFLCERWLALLLALSPMVHAWYFTWLTPFAVATRNAGSIAVSISAFAYFGISALPGIPKNGWPALFFQIGAIWLPFIFGFAWREWRRIGATAEEPSGCAEYNDELRLSQSR